MNEFPKAKEYRQRADTKLTPNITNAVVIYLVFFAILSLASGTAIGGLILAGPLTLGLVKFAKATSNGEKPEIDIMFKGIEQFVPALIVWVLKQLFIFLWSLLFFIPGVIKHYGYSLAMYLLEEDPSIEPMSALKKSEELMRGHKWRLFCLDFSYIGWIILSMLTFGILFLWVKPKMDLAHYEFYRDIRELRHMEVIDIADIK